MGYETRVSQAVSWVDECATEKAPQERCLLLISILLSTLHPAARQVRRGKKIEVGPPVAGRPYLDLGRASGVGVTINMALLTEMGTRRVGSWVALPEFPGALSLARLSEG